jgi:hypothetical protein
MGWDDGAVQLVGDAAVVSHYEADVLQARKHIKQQQTVSTIQLQCRDGMG